MRASRLLQGSFCLVLLFLAACGSGDDTDSTSVPPAASFTVSAGVPVGAVATLDGSASTASGGATLTYSWVLSSKPAGSTATIDNPTTVQPSLAFDVPGTYVVTLTVSDGIKTATASASIIAVAFTPPVILSDLVEPVSGSVQLSLSSDPGSVAITWAVDGVAIGTGNPLTWDTTTVTNGSHTVVARLQFASDYYLDVTRTFQVSQTTVSFFASTLLETNGQFTAYVGAQSANGIVHVSATVDGVALGILAAPNACLDPSEAACASGPNGYAFSGSVVNGSHVVVVTATDGIGNSLGTQLRFTVTDGPS